MSAILEFISKLVCRPNSGRPSQWGDEAESYFLSLTGNVYDKTLVVAAATAKTVFDGSVDEIATATFFAIRSDESCVIELTFDTANTYGTTRQTHSVIGTGIANEMGPPLIFPDCQVYCGYTSPFAAGTLCYVDKVIVKNLSASDSAKVELFYGS